MREPIYVFDCGCRVDKSEVVIGRRTMCKNQDHTTAKLINRIFFCQECGCEILMDKSGPCPSFCKTHKKKQNAYVKVDKKAETRNRSPKMDKILRGKDHCKKYQGCSKSSKINCVTCKKFEAVFFGHDPKPLHDLIWAV